mmetsp:Transcript_33916/g.105346  ORF Transcript_33916/g.105346 Transcript_33916/m.105346 type:complete len:246 (+) Transcript_33916:379-1116(+)
MEVSFGYFMGVPHPRDRLVGRPCLERHGRALLVGRRLSPGLLDSDDLRALPAVRGPVRWCVRQALHWDLCADYGCQHCGRVRLCLHRVSKESPSYSRSHADRLRPSRHAPGVCGDDEISLQPSALAYTDAPHPHHRHRLAKHLLGVGFQARLPGSRARSLGTQPLGDTDELHVPRDVPDAPGDEFGPPTHGTDLRLRGPVRGLSQRHLLDGNDRGRILRVLLYGGDPPLQGACVSRVPGGTSSCL